MFNTHLSLPTTLSKEFWLEPRRLGWGPNQVEEAKNLIRFVQQEKRSDRWVLVGDFNALPGSPAYRVLLDHGCVDSFGNYHEWDEETLGLEWDESEARSIARELGITSSL